MVGCSLSSGYKMLEDTGQVDRCCPDHPDLWCNRLLADSGYQIIHNRATAGASNETIFHTAIEHVMAQRYDLVLVQWSLIDRMNIDIGLELYPTRSLLENGLDIGINPGKIISGRWLDDLGDRLRFVTNSHRRLVKLVQYVNIIKQLQHCQQAKAIFINGVMYLPKDYFEKQQYEIPSQLPTMVQQMLGAATRDDSETRKLYDMTHDQYRRNQGIQPDLWMNLYQPLLPMKIDTIEPNDPHPGWQSQRLFYDFLVQKKDLL